MPENLNEKFTDLLLVKNAFESLQELEKIMSYPAFPLQTVTIATKVPCADFNCLNLVTSVELAHFLKQTMVARLNGLLQ